MCLRFIQFIYFIYIPPFYTFHTRIDYHEAKPLIHPYSYPYTTIPIDSSCPVLYDPPSPIFRTKSFTLHCGLAPPSSSFVPKNPLHDLCKIDTMFIRPFKINCVVWVRKFSKRYEGRKWNNTHAEKYTPIFFERYGENRRKVAWCRQDQKNKNAYFVFPKIAKGMR